MAAARAVSQAVVLLLCTSGSLAGDTCRNDYKGVEEAACRNQGNSCRWCARWKGSSGHWKG
eukprot:COSAG01_NODE_24689_length_770_cov_1.536513_1_plen_60_part_10